MSNADTWPKRHRVRRLLVSLGFALALSGLFAATAQATPGNADWANVPGVSGGEHVDLSHAGEVQSVRKLPIKPSSITEDVDVYVITYDNGVVEPTGNRTSQALVLVPKQGASTTNTYVDIPAYDSNSPATNNVLVTGYLPGASFDATYANNQLKQGVPVVVPQSYGSDNPTYGGRNNGYRVRSAMIAWNTVRSQQTGNTTPQVYKLLGQSGGAIDGSLAAESTALYVAGDDKNTYYLIDNPRDERGMLINSSGRVPSGLIDMAGTGWLRSASPEDQAVASRTVRPTIKLLVQVLNVTQATGIPYADTLVYSVLGALAPDVESIIFRPGTYNTPEVQQMLAHVDELQGVPEGTVILLPKTHDLFVYKSGSYRYAGQLRDAGTTKVQIIEMNDGGTYPGHYRPDAQYIDPVLNGAYDGQGDIVIAGGNTPSLSDTITKFLGEQVVPWIGANVTNKIGPPILNITDALIDGVNNLQAQLQQYVTPQQAPATSAGSASTDTSTASTSSDSQAATQPTNTEQLNTAVDTYVPTEVSEPVREAVQQYVPPTVQKAVTDAIDSVKLPTVPKIVIPQVQLPVIPGLTAH